LPQYQFRQGHAEKFSTRLCKSEQIWVLAEARIGVQQEDGFVCQSITIEREGDSCQKKAAEHHHRAAEHHEHAARHHKEAAKHHEAGKHETAAHHAHLARGHHEHAMHHAAEAAKAHIEDHGKAIAAQA
jgi:hypothetical protein